MPPRARKDVKSAPVSNPIPDVTETKDAPVFDFDALEVRDAPAPLPKARRATKTVDPLLGKVAEKVKVSVDDGYTSKDLGPMPVEQAKKIKALMYRAAREAGHGIKVRDIPSDDPNMITLRFQAKPEKKARRYTADQVREWLATAFTPEDAKEKFGYVTGGRVTAEISKAYREAHDL